MNARELQEHIVTIFKAGLVPMILGSPGIGKSDIIRQIAKLHNLFVIDLRLSQCDPTDLCGFPIHDGKRMNYAPPEHFPLQGMDIPPTGYDGWLLFLDEANSASLAVQSAAYKLVLDRMIGMHHLHKNVAIVMAGNKATDGAIVNRMSTAMQSRLIHLELKVDVPAWLDHAINAEFDHRVISYIEGRPEHLHKFDPKHNDLTFSCPRTWEFTSKLIKGKEVTPSMLPLLVGTLSAGIAHEFHAYMSYCAKLPSIQEIKENPTTVTINQDPAMLYAVSHMVAAYLTEADAPGLILFIRRLPLEFGITSVRAALKRNKALLQVPAIRDWSHEFAKEIF